MNFQAQKMLKQLNKSRFIPHFPFLIPSSKHRYQTLAIITKKQQNKDIIDLLQECRTPKSLPKGNILHTHIIKKGYAGTIIYENHLLNMYTKCGSLKDGRQVFDEMSVKNLLSWNIIISAYSKSENSIESVVILRKMIREKNSDLSFLADHFTYSSVLRACTKSRTMIEGIQIHTMICKCLVEFNEYVHCSLLDMYAKCRKIDCARQVFDKMPYRSMVCWNAMISGLSHNGDYEGSVSMFRNSIRESVELSEFLLSSVLNSCAKISALREGGQVHGVCIKSVFEDHVFVGSALLDMYSKCGSIEDASLVFEKMKCKNLVSWNSMLGALAQYGRGREVLRVFGEMAGSGFQPDAVTFVSVLHGCSHAGMVDEGEACFDSMVKEHGIVPNLRHYACMIDLYGRSGQLSDAEGILRTMPFEPNAAAWGALLGACRIHGNIELAREAAVKLIEIEPENAANSVLLSNIYASCGRWDGVEKIWKMMRRSGVKKDRGLSWIDYKNKVHVFDVGDMSHEQSSEIYALLDDLKEKMKELGYVPETDCVLHDLEQKQKEKLLIHHSEKLALAFGLLNVQQGVRISIKKNIRVCGDCHTTFKFVSTIVKREILLRDTNRFHHFKDGQCSCGDYW